MSIFILRQQKNIKQIIDKILLGIVTHQAKITKRQAILAASLILFPLRCNC